MDVKEAMKIVYEEIKKAKEYSPKGTAIIISPKDFSGRLSARDLWRVLAKIDSEYGIFTVVVAPDATLAHQYDDINDLIKPMHEHKHQYLIAPNDNFDDFQISTLKETIPVKENAEYFPFYMQVMCQTISELGITEENQPTKKEIVGWLNDNYPDLSGNDVRALSTFVRHPDKKQGGWYSNSQKNKKQNLFVFRMLSWVSPNFWHFYDTLSPQRSYLKPANINTSKHLDADIGKS